MSNKFQEKNVLAVSAAHFFHDVYLAFFAPMIPLLMTRFGLSLSAAGILDIARRLPSLATPLIGIMADRQPVRYFIILTPGITAVSMSLIGLSPSYWMVFLLLFIAGLSSVCFHVPAPVIVKGFSGDKIKKGMSFYMSGGAIAGTVGTFIITLIITLYGLDKSYLLMFFGIATSVVLFFRLKNISSVHITRQKTDDNKQYKPIRAFLPFFIILGCFMLFRAGMSLALTLYLPVYLTKSGASLWFAGISLTILHLSGAVGMIGIGYFPDRLSTRKLLFILTFLSVFAMWGLIFFSHIKLLMLICVVLLGILLFSSAPLILTLIQHLNSSRPAFLNSIYFTLGFFINTLGILMVGFTGDNIGLETTFKICATLPLFSLPFLFLLSKKFQTIN